jgi:SAM-dependent methyltransferase
MPFNHNDHYHRLLLRQLPNEARTALDVGCGLGRFARRLEQRGLDVDAVDPSEDVIALAKQRANGSNVRFRAGDATDRELERYDYISCLASIHHMPFDTVTRFRDALNPGGVLAILGCYDDATVSDRLIDVVAIPANAVARLTVYAKDRARGVAPSLSPPARNPEMTFEQLKQESQRLLPGRRIRRLVFWRYLLVYRKPVG